MATATTGKLKERLARRKEIELTVIGRRTGRRIPRPVWFVYEDGKLYLLPVEGSDTEWYKNVLVHPKVWIKAGDVEEEFEVTPVTDPTVVQSVVEKFRHKYGAANIKKYYSKLDVAVIVDIG